MRYKEFLGIPYRTKLDLVFIFIKALIGVSMLYGGFFFGIILLRMLSGWSAW